MFQKLTGEEFDKLKIRGWGRSSPVFNAIISLQVGEAVVIPKALGRGKKTPSSTCRRIEKSYKAKGLKFHCVTLADGTGWAVKRLA